MSFKPYPFQREDALKVEKFDGRVLMAHEPGCGKTIISLLWAKWRPELRPIIVVCPASIKWNWSRIASTHFGMIGEILEGMKPSDKPSFHTQQLFILNYDILKGWCDFLISLKPKLLILDECHALTNRRAIRTRLSKKLAQKIPNVLALSGTPLTNRTAELWQILNIVRPDLYPSFWSFAIDFCSPQMRPWGWDFSGSSNVSKLHKQMSRRLMIRRLKSEVLKDLPEKQQIVVPLEIERRKEYDKANKEFIRWLAEKSLAKARKALAAESLTKVGYLKRLAGELKLKSVCEWVDNFLEESDEKLILFCQHTAIIEALLTRYEGKSVRVDGKVSSKERQKAIDAFLIQKRVRLLIGQTRAAGTGWSAKGVSNVAFVEIGWTPGEHSQAQDRCHGLFRGEEGKHTTVYWLVARDTCEEKILGIITEKQKILDAALDGGKGVSDVNVLDELLAAIMKEKK